MKDQILNNLPTNLMIEGNASTCEIWINKSLLDPALSLQYAKHSLDGFAWGYTGSGPGQLALAILLRFMPAEDALQLYQEFKNEVIAGWAHNDIKIGLDLQHEIRTIIDKRKSKK